MLFEDGKQVAGSASPRIVPVDGTGAGDAFAACLVVSLLEERPVRGGAPARVQGGRLRGGDDRRAAVASRSPPTSRTGSRRNTMPTPIVIDCDPGHDDAIALMLALASPEVELLGVTTVAGNQTLEKTTANALRVLELCGRGDVPVAQGARRSARAQARRRSARARRERARRP